jgi:hypothetical protein
MAVEFAPAPDRSRVSPVSWPAIFASLAVGISVMLLLTLAGVAIGLTVVDPTAFPVANPPDVMPANASAIPPPGNDQVMPEEIGRIMLSE